MRAARATSAVEAAAAPVETAATPISSNAATASAVQPAEASAASVASAATSAGEPPLTRRALRERERAAASVAVTAREARTAASRVSVVEGSAPLYTTRRAMRESATELANSLEVQQASDAFALPVITVASPALGAGEPLAPKPAPRIAPRPAPVQHRSAGATSPAARGASFRGARRLAQRVTAAGALLFIGSLVVVTTLPAQAVQSGAELDPEVAQLETGEQAVHAVDATTTHYLMRDDITVNDQVASARMTEGERAAFQAVADSETAGPSYSGDPAFPRVWSMLETSYVQAPFPSMDQVPISSGFGHRVGGFHGGTDFTPGLGTEIHPIANGVVSAVWQGNNPGGGGYAVFIDHNIDGQFIQSWYAHMGPGSIRVEVGDVVDITDVIGQVGSSGRSTGPHLHLELKNGDYVSFDPYLWLQTREQNLEVAY